MVVCTLIFMAITAGSQPFGTLCIRTFTSTSLSIITLSILACTPRNNLLNTLSLTISTANINRILLFMLKINYFSANFDCTLDTRVNTADGKMDDTLMLLRLYVYYDYK